MAKIKESQNNILEAELISRYFGFIKTEPEEVNKEDIKTANSIKREKEYLDDFLFPIEEACANLRQYKDDKEKDMVEPNIMYYEGSAKGQHKKHRKTAGKELINLHMINVSQGIAEATLIKVADAILKEHGTKNILVRLNDVGGKDAQNNFLREATAYYRKHINDLNNHCRQLFKEGIHYLMTNGKNQCTEIHAGAPKPMDFLDEDSRKRFGEVLEFLETLGIPYEIDHMLLGDPNYSTHTVFEIVEDESKEVLARGSRYDSLARKCGLRKDIPSIGMLLSLKDPKTTTEKSVKKFEKARFYFMQIGYEAKLLCLSIIEELRENNIPVLHKIYRDRLSAQIAAAKKIGTDYLIIIGQKEALSNELIIRDKDSTSQKIVKRNEFINYIKNIK